MSDELLSTPSRPRTRFQKVLAGLKHDPSATPGDQWRIAEEVETCRP